MLIATLGLYLKLNLLLALGALLAWILTDRLKALLPGRISSNVLLKHQRVLFVLLLALPFVWELAAFCFQDLARNINTLASGFKAGEMSISARIDTGLGQLFNLGNLEIRVLWPLMLFLLLGLLLKARHLIGQYRCLHDTVASGTEWKSLGRVSLVIIDACGSPFSTMALGRRHVVLPMKLLNTPRNLRLAVKHELQHIRNGDLGWVLAIEAVKLLCFWNPAVYVWHYLFDSLQELACDEALVEKRRVDASNYSHCLVEIAASTVSPAWAGASNMVPRLAMFSNGAAHLKRRLIMIRKNNRAGFSGLLSMTHAILLVAAFGCSSLLVLAAERDNAPPRPEQDERGEMLPIVTIGPNYPRSALENRIEGWVEVQFTINEEGDVENAAVMDSCAYSGQDTCDESRTDIFNTVSLNAINKFRFNPREENGRPVATPDVRYVFRYNLKGD
jgi:TonB family protein